MLGALNRTSIFNSRSDRPAFTRGHKRATRARCSFRLRHQRTLPHGTVYLLHHFVSKRGLQSLVVGPLGGAESWKRERIFAIPICHSFHTSGRPTQAAQIRIAWSKFTASCSRSPGTFSHRAGMVSTSHAADTALSSGMILAVSLAALGLPTRLGEQVP